MLKSMNGWLGNLCYNKKWCVNIGSIFEKYVNFGDVIFKCFYKMLGRQTKSPFYSLVL